MDKAISTYAFRLLLGAMLLCGISACASSDDNDDDTPTGSNGGGGGCFIATAAFGSLNSATVRSMTNVRDGLIANSTIGNCLVGTYYCISPSMAKQLRNYEPMRMLIRSVFP